jgi:hypothetical protein
MATVLIGPTTKTNNNKNNVYTYIYSTLGSFSAVLSRAENLEPMFCTIVCLLPKLVAAGVCYNIVVVLKRGVHSLVRNGNNIVTCWPGVNFILYFAFLGAFASLWKETVSCCMSVRPSVRLSPCPSVRPPSRPHGTTQIPLDGFAWNLNLLRKFKFY